MPLLLPHAEVSADLLSPLHPLMMFTEDLYFPLVLTQNCTNLNAVPERIFCLVIHCTSISWISCQLELWVFPQYSNFNASHTKFCAIILRFISCSALGNLDSSSCGTVTLLTVARCCFSVHDDFRVFFLFGVFFTTVLRLSGLKLVRSDITFICSWRNRTSNKQRLFLCWGYALVLLLLRKYCNYQQLCTSVRFIPEFVSLKPAEPYEDRNLISHYEH